MGRAIGPPSPSAARRRPAQLRAQVEDAQSDPLPLKLLWNHLLRLLEGQLLLLQSSLSWVRREGWCLKEPKGARPRNITLTSIGVAALRRHKVLQNEQRLAAGANWQDLGLVFPTGVGSPIHSSNFIPQVHYPLLDKAGVPRVRFHDLRHTTAALLISLGVSLKTVQEILGHARISTTGDIYAHVLPGLHSEAMRQLNDLLSSQLQ